MSSRTCLRSPCYRVEWWGDFHPALAPDKSYPVSPPCPEATMTSPWQAGASTRPTGPDALCSGQLENNILQVGCQGGCLLDLRSRACKILRSKSFAHLPEYQAHSLDADCLFLTLTFFVTVSGCAESSLLRAGFLPPQSVGATLHCNAWASHGGFSLCGAQTLGTRPSAAAALGLSSCKQALGHLGSAAVVPEPRCSEVCGYFPDQGLNLCSLQYQADSYPLYPQGSPQIACFSFSFPLPQSPAGKF